MLGLGHDTFDGGHLFPGLDPFIDLCAIVLDYLFDDSELIGYFLSDCFPQVLQGLKKPLNHANIINYKLNASFDDFKVIIAVRAIVSLL